MHLTKNEQVSLIIGGIILILAVVSDFILSNSNQVLENTIWAGASLVFSVIFSYTFLIQPLTSKQTTEHTGFLSKPRESFKPFISPPSKLEKKTQLKGHCEICNDQIMLGFTCSYCNGYFCPEHRLPEKHRCSGMRGKN